LLTNGMILDSPIVPHVQFGMTLTELKKVLSVSVKTCQQSETGSIYVYVARLPLSY